MMSTRDRFAIVGRGEEIRVLRAAFQNSMDGCCCDPDDHDLSQPCRELLDDHHDRATASKERQEFVLIQGPSGCGKTCLATTLQEYVQLQSSAFFLAAKFELTSVQKPYAAVANIFQQFVDGIFKNASGEKYFEYDLDEIRQVVQDAVGSEGALLSQVLPSLERLIGKQPTTAQQQHQCNTHGKPNSIRQFHYVFCKLCRAISAIVPLVFFFDDLQWSDDATLKLLEALLQSQSKFDSRTSTLLVVAACRSDTEPSDNSWERRNCSILASFLSDLESHHAGGVINLTTICLGNLDQMSIHQLVARFRKQSSESCEALAHDVFSNSQGSPFHAMRILKDLAPQQNRFDRLDNTAHGQSCADDRSLGSESFQNNAMNWYVPDQLNSLPDDSQKVLQVSACLGDEIDENAVAIVLGMGNKEVHSALKVASDHELLVLNSDRGLFKFSHDQIRQAVMAQISDLEATSFYIGHTLWAKDSPLYISTNMFVVVNLLGHGRKLLTDPVERYGVAAFCWEAGIKAATMANFADSSRYLNIGIDFLHEGNNYWAEQYDLSLKIFNAAADTEVCTQNFDRAMELVQEVLDNGRTLHDKMLAYVAKINCLCQAGHTQQAINLGVDILQQLGEPLPHLVTKRSIICETLLTKLAWRRCSNCDMMNLPPMINNDKLHAMQLLSILVPYAFQARSFYNPLMATRMVRLCLTHGFHKSGVIGLVTYAWVICAYNRREGYRLGCLAMSMVERLRAKEMMPRVQISFYGFTHHWRRPVRESIEPLRRAAEAAMEIGDVECAMWALHLRCIHVLASGLPLPKVEVELKKAVEQMKLYKQDNVLQLVSVTHQLIHNLMGRASEPTVLGGETVPSTANCSTTPHAVLVNFGRISIEANLAYKFGNYARAGELIDIRRKMNYEHFATFNCTSVRQLEALISISCARIGQDSTRNCSIARKALKHITSWANDCPENFSCMQQMIEAELMSMKRHRGVNSRILALFDQAIKGATVEGFTQQAALANELAGNYLSRQGESGMAKNYLVEAQAKYTAWGATAKAEHLKALSNASSYQAAAEN